MGCSTAADLGAVEVIASVFRIDISEDKIAKQKWCRTFKWFNSVDHEWEKTYPLLEELLSQWNGSGSDDYGRLLRTRNREDGNVRDTSDDDWWPSSEQEEDGDEDAESISTGNGEDQCENEDT